MSLFNKTVDDLQDVKKPRSGFVNSIHHFGKSYLQRKGSDYYLLWQTRKSLSNIGSVHKLTRKQYQEIKQRLGPEYVRKEHQDFLEIIHMHERKHYMRVLRYLQKEEIL